MRILIVGAGAIGGVTAAYMTLGGCDTTLMCSRESAAEKIRTDGLHICGKRGETSVRMNAVSSAFELEGTFDAVLIVTKAYDMQEAAKSILPYVKTESIVVSVQNGICIDMLSDIVGADRAAAAVVTWSSTMHGDANLEITAEGEFIIGRQDRSVKRLEQLKKAMDTVFPTKISENITANMFSKLVINSGITCGGAMTGQTLGEMLRGSEARRFFIKTVMEDMRVAEAMGLRVPPFGGKLDYYKFIRGNGAAADLRRNIVLRAVGHKYKNLTSSSLTALRRSRPTEAPYLNGWVSRQGAKLGVPTPINDAVCRIISEIEAGKRKISPENLKEIP